MVRNMAIPQGVKPRPPPIDGSDKTKAAEPTPDMIAPRGCKPYAVMRAEAGERGMGAGGTPR